MELMENREMITSRDLLKKINELREKEYEKKAKAGTLTESEIKRGKFIELRRDLSLDHKSRRQHREV